MKLAAALCLPVLLASCAGLDRNDQGRLQPQTVNGPCDVKKFFLLGQTAVHTRMTVSNTGAACSITILNPDVQAIINAALVTERPQHGEATAGVLLNGVQAGASYQPVPGYTGPDHFTVTLEPNDHAISIDVTVR